MYAERIFLSACSEMEMSEIGGMEGFQTPLPPSPDFETCIRRTELFKGTSPSAVVAPGAKSVGKRGGCEWAGN